MEPPLRLGRMVRQIGDAIKEAGYGPGVGDGLCPRAHSFGRRAALTVVPDISPHAGRETPAPMISLICSVENLAKA